MILWKTDPRPLEYRGTASTNLLNDVCGQGLCLSLLFDPASRCWDTSDLVSTPIPPNKAELKKSIEAFKYSLELTSDEIRHLERKTREQRNSPEWFAARRFRITASIFGDIIHRRPETDTDIW